MGGRNNGWEEHWSERSTLKFAASGLLYPAEQCDKMVSSLHGPRVRYETNFGAFF